MQCKWFARLVIVLFSLSLPVIAQMNVMPSSCPVGISKFNPSGSNGFTVRLENLKAKKIVGMAFNVALSDATENWRWFHYDDDPTRPLVGFNWNEEIEPRAVKTLTWGSGGGNFGHGGAAAFVLTSVLFEDGSSWNELPNRASCQALWYDYPKKGQTKAVVLPIRQ